MKSGSPASESTLITAVAATGGMRHSRSRMPKIAKENACRHEHGIAGQSMRAQGLERFGADDDQADDHDQRSADAARGQGLPEHQGGQQQAAERGA